MANTRRYGATVRLDSGLLIPASAGVGKLLTSDASGNATWAALNWAAVEAVNAKLEQTVAIQVATLNGLGFLRGLGKATAEIAAKGILFTLPLAARPETARNVSYSTNSGTSTANLQVKVNGECETSVVLASGKLPTFDGLSFSL